MTDNFVSVITTIQNPTGAVRQLVSKLHGLGATLILIGDKNGPASYELEGTKFLSLKDQLDSPFELARALPTGHYARKNIGYLAAMTQGASCVYETDDDNAPLPEWHLRNETVQAIEIREKGWVNVYRFFTKELVWPRGFPLEEIQASFRPGLAAPEHPITVRAPIQQGLADNSPDVDAIWRLTLDRPLQFRQGQSIYLKPESWCPFNSQSTWWWPEAFPLMYLPSHCSFRMTDIWRSFVAQRCLWEMGYGIVFHGPEVMQERNQHDLMRDFKDEIPGYLRNKEMVSVLEDLSLQGGLDNPGHNLRRCYEALVVKEFFPREELGLLDAWLNDIEKLKVSSKQC